MAEKISMDDLIRKFRSNSSPVIREYLLLHARPFFYTFEKLSYIFLDEISRGQYLFYLLRIEDACREMANPPVYIKDVLALAERRDSYILHEAVLRDVLIYPLQIVRIAPYLDEDEKYWDEASRTVLAMLISYVLERITEEDRNLKTVKKFLNLCNRTVIEKIFTEVERTDPESFALDKYESFNKVFEADKPFSCIQSFAATSLDIFTLEGVENMMTNPDKVDLKVIGREKTAVFLNVDDTDRSMDKFVNIFYTQALQMLVEEADSRPESCLKVPVRFILDDFATNTIIPDFDNIISVIRSRGMSVSIIIHNVTQLEGLYDPCRANTIISNCDTVLYLGGQDERTASMVAARTGDSLLDVLYMKMNEVYILRPYGKNKKAKKYNLADHPGYVNVMNVFGKDESEPYEEEEEEKRVIGFQV